MVFPFELQAVARNRVMVGQQHALDAGLFAKVEVVFVGWGTPGSDGTFRDALGFIRNDQVPVQVDGVTKALALGASTQRAVEAE